MQISPLQTNLDPDKEVLMSIQKLYLELTNKCNLNCAFCYRHSWDEPPLDMPLPLLQKLSNEIIRMGSLKTVVLGGIGEPTCAPLIGEALERFGKYDVTLTTNAVKIDPVLLKLIAKYVNLVMVSIDGFHENFAKIRGTPLDAVLENLQQLTRLKVKNGTSLPQLGIQLVLNSDNASDVFKLVDLVHDLPASFLVISNLLPQTPENAAKILYTRYENKEIKHLFNKLATYSLRKGVQTFLPNYELKTERLCSFMEDNATMVSVSGDIVPCYRLSHTYCEYVFGREKRVLQHTFGNLKDQSLEQIWTNPQYVNFRTTVKNNRYPSCIDCDLADGCEMVQDTRSDCYTNSPSCADCLWTRKIIMCP